MGKRSKDLLDDDAIAEALDLTDAELDLDGKWVNQPNLVYQYSKIAAEAARELSRQEKAVKGIEADLAVKMRTKPARYGIEKVTEAAITAAVKTHDKYKEALDLLVDLEYKVALTRGICFALNDRRYALQSLTTLHTNNYAAGVSYPTTGVKNRKTKE